jgi:sugar phosphate isomerase/epimerase
MAKEPPLSICEFTTFPASFADDLAAYSTAGLAGIGVCESKLGPGDEERLLESGLQATTCVAAVPSILPLPLFPGPEDPAEGIEALAASIRRLADAAGEEGVALLLEPVHSSQHDTFSFVNTIPDALDLLADARAENVRLLFGTWHFGDTPLVQAQIAEYAGSFGGVHVSDRREPTRNEFDRLLPGDGVLPLPRLLRAVDEAGWDGFYEVEIFSDEAFEDSLWRLPAEDTARRAHEGFERVWEEAHAHA